MAENLKDLEVIAIDTGNRLIKTPNFDFIAGIKEMENPPIMEDVLTIKVDGVKKNFVLVNEGLVHEKNKTLDENYFYLSLIAAAKELIFKYRPDGKNDRPIMADVAFAIGYPPSQGNLTKPLFDYFYREGKLQEFEFSQNGKTYHFYLTPKRVEIYPQAYSGALPQLTKVANEPISYIVDIGGYTTDIFRLAYGRPDHSVCKSFEGFGAIPLCDEIIQAVSDNCDFILFATQVEAYLKDGKSLATDKANEIASEVAEKYVEKLLGTIKQQKIDIKNNIPIMIGGGSLLMRKFIEPELSSKAIFVQNIRANVKGYEYMTKKRYKII